MSLFQKSVVNKYLKNLNQQAVEEAYKQFQQFYDDAERIENIRLLKEENYQEGFLREIFVDVLGYTINPNKNYNLTTEYKNESDSKKADGAILHEGKAIGVIELKSTKTPDLNSIRDQAFNYKNNQSNCRFVITSNFEKLRLYIDNATDWEEFNLFHLDYDNFCRFYLFLNKDNLFNGITAKLKEESKLHEEDVTGKLYNDYSFFKQQLFNDLIKNNPKIDKLLLFHKSQKLLDRILFILFAEDRGLLPPNAITKIVEQWKSLKELDEEKSLYSRFVKLFHHLDEGHKYKEYELPAYNGGLFKKDEIIDRLIISDEVLHSNSLKLSTYDFNTEVDVNILGHIFENSITEIEQVKAEIEGQQSDKNRSLRKKEGIFYTPKYITKYIVDNTIGALCAEKKNELGIDEIENEIIENSRTSKGKLTKKAESLLQKLNEYRDYLKSLKILDPACGSGAFLNQALEFLINEHEQIDSYRRELEQDSLGLYDITKSILENNLYGVDINEEAVEIAKLSLWIRTAERGRKLSDLSKNIKCGNSLIDDPAVAGDKAFNWNKEFPEIMSNGGFNVVIGNPPYVNVEMISKIDKNYFNNHFSTFYKRSDLFSLFIELSLTTLTKSGIVCYIIPSQILNNLSYKIIRELILNNKWLKEVCYVGNKVFIDAVNDVVILILHKKENQLVNLINALTFDRPILNQVDFDYFKDFNNQISISSDNKSDSIYKKLSNKKHSKIKDYFDVFQGIVTGNNPVFIFDDYSDCQEIDLEVQLLKPLVHGRDFGKWIIENKDRKILYVNGSTFIQNYPNALSWLEKHKVELSKRRECIKGVIPWYSLQWPREVEKLDKVPKILVQSTRNERLKTRIVATIDETGVYGSQGLNFIINTGSSKSIYSLLAVLNSTVINFLFKTKLLNLAIKAEYIREISLPDFSNGEEMKLEQFSKLMLSANNSLFNKQGSFLSRIHSNFSIDKLSNKLKEFYNYDFKTFLSELKKKKITLTLKQQDEWEQYFNEYKTEINKLQQQIAQTDKEIDQLVYKLYGLTPEEIKIVEEN